MAYVYLSLSHLHIYTLHYSTHFYLDFCGLTENFPL